MSFYKGFKSYPVKYKVSDADSRKRMPALNCMWRCLRDFIPVKKSFSKRLIRRQWWIEILKAILLKSVRTRREWKYSNATLQLDPKWKVWISGVKRSLKCYEFYPRLFLIHLPIHVSFVCVSLILYSSIEKSLCYKRPIA